MVPRRADSPHAPTQLVAAQNVSRTGTPVPPPAPPPPPPPGDGADVAGLIGNDVHSDVHVIRVLTFGGQRQVWVGCDGGVFVSTQGGRVNSFGSRSTGMAALEVGFVATHPTSSHFLAIGCQDNAAQMRTGDAVWEQTTLGDSGGVAFHPINSQFIVSQAFRAVWRGRPVAGYVGPINRVGRAAIWRAAAHRDARAGCPRSTQAPRPCG